MWPKHRVFGIDREALHQEMARRELARRARIDQLEQEIGRMRAELKGLQAEEARLQTLHRDLNAGLSHDETAPPKKEPPFQCELEPHILTLQRIQAEITYLRATRARIIDQVREALLPFLNDASQAPSGPAAPNPDAKEAANV